jgi:hypothetical protein
MIAIASPDTGVTVWGSAVPGHIHKALAGLACR